MENLIGEKELNEKMEGVDIYHIVSALYNKGAILQL